MQPVKLSRIGNKSARQFLLESKAIITESSDESGKFVVEK